MEPRYGFLSGCFGDGYPKMFGPQPGWPTGDGAVLTHQPIARSLGTMKNGADFICTADAELALNGYAASRVTFGHSGQLCQISGPPASYSL